jgi:hypothetical protein
MEDAMVRIVEMDAMNTQPQEFEGAILVRDFLDEVQGLDNMVRVAEEMIVAAIAIIEREAGAHEARYVLKTADKVLAKG